MKQFNRFAGRRLGAAAALTLAAMLASLTLAPAAFAGPTAARPAATSATTQPKAAASTVATTQVTNGVRPAGVISCMGVLKNHGYDYSYRRLLSCFAGQFGTASGQAACFTGLVATGVFIPTAVEACLAAMSM